jgi:hypothetical protein
MFHLRLHLLEDPIVNVPMESEQAVQSRPLLLRSAFHCLALRSPFVEFANCFQDLNADTQKIGFLIEMVLDETET